MNAETICTMIKDMIKYGRMDDETKGYNKALLDVERKVREEYNREIQSRAREL